MSRHWEPRGANDHSPAELIQQEAKLKRMVTIWMFIRNYISGSRAWYDALSTYYRDLGTGKNPLCHELFVNISSMGGSSPFFILAHTAQHALNANRITGYARSEEEMLADPEVQDIVKTVKGYLAEVDRRGGVEHWTKEFEKIYTWSKETELIFKPDTPMHIRLEIIQMEIANAPLKDKMKHRYRYILPGDDGYKPGLYSPKHTPVKENVATRPAGFVTPAPEGGSSVPGDETPTIGGTRRREDGRARPLGRSGLRHQDGSGEEDEDEGDGGDERNTGGSADNAVSNGITGSEETSAARGGSSGGSAHGSSNAATGLSTSDSAEGRAPPNDRARSQSGGQPSEEISGQTIGNASSTTIGVDDRATSGADASTLATGTGTGTGSGSGSGSGFGSGSAAPFAGNPDPASAPATNSTTTLPPSATTIFGPGSTGGSGSLFGRESRGSSSLTAFSGGGSFLGGLGTNSNSSNNLNTAGSSSFVGGGIAALFGRSRGESENGAGGSGSRTLAKSGERAEEEKENESHRQGQGRGQAAPPAPAPGRAPDPATSPAGTPAGTPAATITEQEHSAPLTAGTQNDKEGQQVPTQEEAVNNTAEPAAPANRDDNHVDNVADMMVDQEQNDALEGFVDLTEAKKAWAEREIGHLGSLLKELVIKETPTILINGVVTQISRDDALERVSVAITNIANLRNSWSNTEVGIRELKTAKEVRDVGRSMEMTNVLSVYNNLPVKYEHLRRAPDGPTLRQREKHTKILTSNGMKCSLATGVQLDVDAVSRRFWLTSDKLAAMASESYSGGGKAAYPLNGLEMPKLDSNARTAFHMTRAKTAEETLGFHSWTHVPEFLPKVPMTTRGPGKRPVDAVDQDAKGKKKSKD